MASDADIARPLTATDVDEIAGIAAEGVPIGPSMVGRLVADWRRLTAENAALRKAMPNSDLLFNAAYLLRGTCDDTCIAMAPSLERAVAGILALAADDDARADALVELVRRA